MKKKYTIPALEIVHIDASDIIATSNLGIGTGPGSGIVGAREGWWDDEEDW